MHARRLLAAVGCAAALLLWPACHGGGGETAAPPTPSPALSTISLGRTVELPADGATAAEIAVLLRDTSGEAIAGGLITVDLTGSDNAVSPALPVTDENGRATIAIRSTRAESKVLQLRAGANQDVRLLPPQELRFVATDPTHDRSIVEAPAAFAAADGATEVPIDVVLRDRHDNPVADHDVELRTDAPGTVITQPRAASDQAGRVRGTIRSLRAGRVQVTASVATASGPMTLLTTAAVRFADRPRVAQAAAYADVDRDGRCGAGDTVTVPLSETVVLARPVPAADLLALPVAGDAFGDGAAVTRGYADDRLTVRLGPGAKVRARGAFALSRRGSDAASGMDLASTAAVVASSITGLAAAPSTPADLFADFVPTPTLFDLQARAATKADIDGDGMTDVVLGGDNGTVRAWFGQRGAGPMRPQTLLQLEEPIASLAALDVDRDGHVDIAVGGARQNLWLLRGLGGGRFAAAIALLPLGGSALAAADLDSDGRDEIVYAATDGRCWVGGRGGSTVFVPVLDLGRPAHALALADFDLDGDLDIAVDTTDESVSVFTNNGAMAFAPSATFPVHAPTALATADIDRDGDVDLLCAGADGVDILRNQRRLGLAADPPLQIGPVLALLALDLDGDGRVDLAIGGVGGGLWHNDGTSFARLPSEVTAATWRGVLAADFDGDGDVDLLAVRADASPLLYAGSASAVRGPLLLAPAAPLAMVAGVTAQAIADVDRDGDLDVVLALAGGGTRVLLNDGDGVLRDSGQVLGGFDHPLAIAIGDLDGDGDPDFVTGNTVGAAERVYLNDGNGRFTETTQALGAGHTTSVALGDVDGDGDLDLVVGNLGVAGEDNRLFLNDGHAMFHDAGLSLGSVETRAVVLVDVDSDGNLDLVIADARGEARLWRGDGHGAFNDKGPCLRQGRIAGLAVGDLDGDGDADLWVASDDGTGDRIWRNDGHGVFSDSGQRLGGAFTTSVRLADVDGDGRLDAVTTRLGGSSRLWLNDGSATFAPTTLDLPAGVIASVGDFDLDGSADVVVSNSTGHVQLMRRL